MFKHTVGVHVRAIVVFVVSNQPPTSTWETRTAVQIPLISCKSHLEHYTSCMSCAAEKPCEIQGILCFSALKPTPHKSNNAVSVPRYMLFPRRSFPEDTGSSFFALFPFLTLNRLRVFRHLKQNIDAESTKWTHPCGS